MAVKLKKKKRLNFIPLNAPGMPLPGGDFLRIAGEKGDTTELKGKGKTEHLVSVGEQLELLYRQALYSNSFSLPITIKPKAGITKVMPFVPGHLWGGDPCGPKPADVMILGKMPGRDEIANGRNLCGPSGALLLDACRSLGIKGMPNWYVTNLLKFAHPEDKSTIKIDWIKNCLPLLHQELRLVRPKYILCLGADASKVLLGKKATIDYMHGRVGEIQIPLHENEDEEPRYHTACVMSCVHPAFVLAAPEKSRQFEFTLARFGQLIKGIRFDEEEKDVDHRIIDNEDDLKALFKEIRRDCKNRLIAVDAEWHGEHPQNVGAYLRTIQLSWADKRAVCIVLRGSGGTPVFKSSPAKACKLLNRFLQDFRVCGHYFNADLEWLIYHGIDLRKAFEAPEDWRDTVNQGGFDTGLAEHAITETAEFGLEALTMRYTTAPRYDIALYDWKHKYCLKHGLKAKDLEGYGPCPDVILVGEVTGPPKAGKPGTPVRNSYACYDADVTRRIALKQQKLLSCDHFGNNCREAFWMSMRAASGVLEIHQTGLCIDRNKVDELTMTYISAKNRLAAKIRQWARWPDFKLGSTFQVREFLFGERYNGKDTEGGGFTKLRPAGALSLYLDPLLDTSKRPVSWQEIKERGEEEEHTAGTGKMVLSILAQESQEVPLKNQHGQIVLGKDNLPKLVDRSEQVNWIRDYRFITQVLQATLRYPLVDNNGSYIYDDNGYFTYKYGLPGSICPDGRVRTHISQTKETGRWSSWGPPLQNLSKRREVDYKRILAHQYRYPLRSIICAGNGKVLIEADYIGAELFGMAILSGDPLMIEHATRNQLPEDHPDYYDIHSNVAVMAFGYTCPPTKEGLGSIGKKHMRIVAKSVIFGIAYGRGAKAIALAAKEEGVYITVDEAQAVIDAIFSMYPMLQPFFEVCRQRAVNERWICGSMGRFRRCEPTKDKKVLGDLQRQFMNFPIQGLIADAVSRAFDHLYHYRLRPECRVDYKIALQIHDAIVLEAEPQYVAEIVDHVLPLCMCKSVPIYPCHLDGMPTGTGPFYLGIDTDVFQNWGITMTLDQCKSLKFDPKYAHVKAA